MRRWLCLLLMAAPLAAQVDFLTADEIDRVRDAQEPNARLALYAAFAKDRVALVQDLLAKDKPGRSILVHDALDAYTEILDAIDTVADDAAAKKKDIKQGLNVVAGAEKETLAALQKIQESQPADLERYAFSLEMAIDTTTDSLDAAMEDLDTRGAEAQAREEREKKAQEEAMAPADGSKPQAKKSGAAKSGATPAAPARKAPTLARPGEKKQ